MGTFRLFLLLMLSLTLVYSDKLCPAKCTCERGVVRCIHQGLLAVPKVQHDARTLDVRFNKIFDFAPGSFSTLHRLRSLLLNDNQLRALYSGAFDGLKQLVYLYLYRNRISHIDADVFSGMDRLEQLYLQVNEIHQIAPPTFTNLPGLERLYLHNNLISSLPAGALDALPRLQKLRLDSNALECNCSVLWLVRWLAVRPGLGLAATCHAPAAVQGLPLAAIKEGDFNCQEPTIMSEPKDALVDLGQDAIFSCEAVGEPAPEIIWLYDSNKIIPKNSQRYEIMKNGSLMVHNADESDVGVFECMAKNQVGEARSRSARMILQITSGETDRLTFTHSPRDQIVRIQSAVNFDCMAKGNPLPHIIWFFKGERMLLNEWMTLQHNGSLFIEHVDQTDVGTYTCKAENIYESISASAELKVLSPPLFTVVPTDEIMLVGDRVEFLCKARGSPEPEISWYRDTLNLPESENIKYSNNNTNLTIIEISPDDAGLYHCRAANSEGLTEISVVLQVKEYDLIKPQILLRPEDTVAYSETTVQLSCEYDSSPPAFVEWSKDGSRITEGDRISITPIGNLIINNVTLVDFGSYECTVFNEHGRDTASAFLTVKDHVLPGDEYVNIALTEATRDVDQAIARTVETIFSNNTVEKGVHDLFRVSRFPNAPARDIARAAEIYERTLYMVKEFTEAGKSANSTEPFNYHNVLSPKHLEVIARLSGCTAHREEKDCSDMCYHKKYRSIDGSCNNFDHPMWGSSLTGFRRILLPIYENGFSQPVGWDKRKKYNGYSLPSARKVSTSIITTVEISEDVAITHMTMQWGQWLDHDLDHALPSVSSETWDGVDCKKTCDYAAPCFPIDVPADDPRVTNRRCIDFIRTSSVCGSGMTSVLFGKLQPREQINQLTSYIDASQVYGYEKTVAQDLRDLTNDNGLLRVGASFPGKKPLLPTDGLTAMDCRRNLTESTRNCFVAGDIRANEQIGLAAMHTIWMREHNRIALNLKLVNPFWSGDKVYQEARKVVGAEIQFITYNHWLPIIVGPEGAKQLGPYKGYDRKINPSVSNVFATAALRFGHSMINPVLDRLDENFETIPQGNLQLRYAFFSPWRIVDEGGVDPLLRGMFMTPAKLKTPKQNLNSELTERLFETAHAVALDLAAINIQRGRDHAIPPYTMWRQFCNMTEVNSFDDLAGEISDQQVRDKLKELYGSVDNIDVWVGGILEDQVTGGKVGPLFRCLLLEQFRRLRDGDRFWYENSMTFKPEQLQQIKQTSLARVLCDNGDNIDTIGENVFLLPEMQDGLIACDDLQNIDFRFWTDCETCGDEFLAREKREISAPDAGERQHIRQLEDSQVYLEEAVEGLKKRINDLEQLCQN